METERDHFYLFLLSNNSTSVYTTNTLSSFTNKLARDIKLNENWVVGLTEIAFNALPTISQRFTSPSTNPLAESSGDDEGDDGGDIDMTVEEFVVNNNNTRRRRGNSFTFVSIDIDGNYCIEISSHDMDSMCYKSKHLNMGKLLEQIGNFVKLKKGVVAVDGDETVLETTKQEVKKQILAIIANGEYVNLPQKNIKPASTDYIVHLYMGSSISDNIVLHRNTYENIHSFVIGIVEQLPVKRRNLNDLKLLFNIFHHKYRVPDNDGDVVSGVTKEQTSTPFVKIHFDEFSTNASLDTRTFSSDPVALKTLVGRFREGLLFKNEQNMTEGDKKNIRLAIGQAVLDVHRGNRFKAPQKVKKKERIQHKSGGALRKTAGGWPV